MGGTFLGTSNKGNPFKYRERDVHGNIQTRDYSHKAVENFKGLKLDCLFIVGGDDDDRSMHRADGLLGLIDMEFHAVEFEQKIVGEFDVRLIDLVDQQDRSLFKRKRLP